MLLLAIQKQHLPGEDAYASDNHEPLFDYDFDVSPTDADNIRYLYDSSVTLAKQTNLTIALVSGR